jgi:hypothetical protein
MVTVPSHTFHKLLKKDNIVTLLRDTLMHRDAGKRNPDIRIDLPDPDEDSFYEAVFTMKHILNIMWIDSSKIFVIVFKTWEFQALWEVPVDDFVWTGQSFRVLANFLELCEENHVSFHDWVVMGTEADAKDKILLDSIKAIRVTQQQLQTCGLTEAQERFSRHLMDVVEKDVITSHAELFRRYVLLFLNPKP